MEFLIICSVAILGSALTFFSGFGLGTLLVPVFALFFPIEVAIALTAIVHFLNNIFKAILIGKKADTGIVIRFGIPAVIASFAGAYVLTMLSGMPPLYEYNVFERAFSLTPIKLIIAVLLAFFALFDLIPRLAKLHFPRKYLPIGGLLSGFFGGLSGHQGALRTLFLIKANLTKEAFIATGVMIALLIDISRLAVYSRNIFKHGNEFDYAIVVSATLSAFLGAYIGSKLLKKVTIQAVQIVVGVMLFIFAILLGAGVI